MNEILMIPRAGCGWVWVVRKNKINYQECGFYLLIKKIIGDVDSYLLIKNYQRCGLYLLI